MRHLRTKCLMLTTIGVCLSALPVRLAVAGVVDSPIPSLNGSSSRHVFTIPGVIKNNNLETVFMCTSLDKKNLTVGVEVFGAAGGSPLNNVLAGEGVETITPGSTATIATGASVGIHEDDVIPLGPASLRNGSARIISTSKKIGCVAFIVDELNDPPSMMAPLKILYKKQRGE